MKRGRDDVRDFSDVITLNVGGECFMTRKKTLCVEKDSLLAQIFNINFDRDDTENFLFCFDDHGNLFFDRDPETFKVILNALRRGGKLIGVKNCTPDFIHQVREDAAFFRLKGLVREIDQHVADTERFWNEASRAMTLVGAEEVNAHRDAKLLLDYVIGQHRSPSNTPPSATSRPIRFSPEMNIHVNCRPTNDGPVNRGSRNSLRSNDTNSIPNQHRHLDAQQQQQHILSTFGTESCETEIVSGEEDSEESEKETVMKDEERPNVDGSVKEIEANTGAQQQVLVPEKPASKTPSMLSSPPVHPTKNEHEEEQRSTKPVLPTNEHHATMESDDASPGMQGDIRNDREHSNVQAPCNTSTAPETGTVQPVAKVVPV